MLAELPVSCPTLIEDAHSSWHLYPVRLHTNAIQRSHREVFEAMREAGIGVNLHYMPVHLQPDYRRLGFKPGQFPEAEAYAQEAISLPLYSGLSNADQDRVVNILASLPD